MTPVTQCTSQEMAQRLRDSGLLRDPESFLQETGGCEQSIDDLKRRWLADGRLTEYQLNWLIAPNSDPIVLSDYIIQDRIGQGGMGS
ncbi:MAG: hypothetical protein KDA96_19105, partial [Planctomycetaceae bacterium]|nr:hypothetical protein [Planctomycetaceae bacterium]